MKVLISSENNLTDPKLLNMLNKLHLKGTYYAPFYKM